MFALKHERVTGVHLLIGNHPSAVSACALPHIAIACLLKCRADMMPFDFPDHSEVNPEDPASSIVTPM